MPPCLFGCGGVLYGTQINTSKAERKILTALEVFCVIVLFF